MPGPVARPERRLRALLGAVILGVTVALVSSCTSLRVAHDAPPSSSATVSTAADRATLAALTAAIRDRDRLDFDHLLATRDPRFTAAAARIYDNLSKLPLTSFSLRLGGRQQRVSPQRQAMLQDPARVQQVIVTWQLVGDSGVAEHRLWFTFVTMGSVSRLAGTADGPVERAAQPVWLLDRLRVQRTAATTALVSESDATAGTDWGQRGDAAAAVVRARV